MKHARGSLSVDTDPGLQKLEVLVDELIKDSPHEERVRRCMEAAGLHYTTDPIARMNSVLAALDRVRHGSRSPERNT